ncbi:hypothetical protein LCGC14_2587010 [marine sediment metagenome]|uniref:Uncharacterized protein n=1 Tax=marine sediment metagenome TaxID=412755 RepID=A0A0F9AD61_9ZZZZ
MSLMIREFKILKNGGNIRIMLIPRIEEKTTELLDFHLKNELKKKIVFRHLVSWDLHMVYRLESKILNISVNDPYINLNLEDKLPEIPVPWFALNFEEFNQRTETLWSFNDNPNILFWKTLFQKTREELLKYFSKILERNGRDKHSETLQLLGGCLNHTRTHLEQLKSY